MSSGRAAPAAPKTLPRGTVAKWACRARYSVRTTMSAYPFPYLAMVRRKYAGIPERVVRPDTALVIEGFQRSGNTFATFAFTSSQREPVRVAHHLHAAAQVVEAVRLGIPTLVLVRAPEETVLSHMVREPCAGAGQALANWVRFHRQVLRHRRGLVVGSFEEVTNDFGAVVRRVNERFGTSFDAFDHTEANVEKVFDLIESTNRTRFGAVVEGTVARPSAERSRRKDELRAAYRAPGLARRRAEAERLYRTLTGSDT